VADEPEQLEDLLRRLIREELERGNLDKLIQAGQALRGSFNIAVHPRIGMDAGPPPGAGSFSISVTPRLGFDVGPNHQVVMPQAADLKIEGGQPAVNVEAALGGGGTLTAEAHVVVEPVIRAEGDLVPPEVVDTIRSATPKVADEIQARDPVGAKQIAEQYTALINLLVALVTAYHFLHPAAPMTTQQVVQIFDHSQHVTNQTTIVNPPQAPGPGPTP
jgi:hypothetical protein